MQILRTVLHTFPRELVKRICVKTCYPEVFSSFLHYKVKPTDSSLQFSEAENALQAKCNRNPLSKALLLMHMAGQAVTSRSHVGTERQAQLLQV